MKVTICIGSSCHIKGSRRVVEKFQELISKYELSDVVELGGTFCMGHCQEGVCVTIDNEFYSVSPENAESFFEKEIRDDPALLPYDHVAWSEIRPSLRELIRGKRPPVFFRFVLLLKPEYTKAMLEKEGDRELLDCVGSFVLTVSYRDSEVSILTGISMKSFTLNKNADILWDKTVRKFLQAKEIAFEPMA